MPEITSSVGNNGTNAVHDVALVQLMLAKIKSPGGGVYFTHGYMDRVGPDTGRAISSFQSDNSLTGPKAPGEIAGLITPSGKTWAALKEAFASADAKFRSVRTWNGVAVAYLAMTQKTLDAAVALVNKEPLNSEFRQEVIKLIQRCYAESQLVWCIVPKTGGWRAFAGQEGVISDASYGETIHNYGYAVDLTIRNLSWVDARLQIHTTILKEVDKHVQPQFFDARDRISNTMKLHPTEKKNDRYHLQAFLDEPLDSVKSFMVLMERKGPRKMKWEPRFKSPTDYLCDLGLGGALYYVGTAKHIWNQDAARGITKENLVAALRAKIKADPSFSLDSFFGRASSKLSADFKDNDIGDAQLAAVRRILKAEFDATASKWGEWQPVNYPDKKRREKNPNP